MSFSVLGIEIKRISKNDRENIIKEINSKIQSYEPDIFILPEKWLIDKLTQDEALELSKELLIENIPIALPGSFSILDGNFLFNRALIFNFGKFIGFQDKIIPYRTEKRHYYPGNKIKIFKLEGIRISAPICYDIDFPFYGRISAANGVDLIINPSLIKMEFKEEWHYYIIARSLENRIPVISVNSSFQFAGGSIFVHPYRHNIGAKLRIIESSDGVVFGKLVLEDFRDIRDIRISEDPGIYRAKGIDVIEI